MGRIYNVYVSDNDTTRSYKYRSSALRFAKQKIKELNHELGIRDAYVRVYEIEHLPKFCKSLIAEFSTD